MLLKMHSPVQASLAATALAVLCLSTLLPLPAHCEALDIANAFRPHRMQRRSFFEISCKGIYDKSIFARLDRICEDCYSLFREPQLHSLCKKNCFTSDYFKGCLEALQLQDEMESIQTSIKQLHGADPGV